MKQPTIAHHRPIKIELEEGREYYYCSCGLSVNQPFCDGSHAKTEFSPIRFVAERTGPKAFCRCKVTGNAPFCDGSHKPLTEEHIGQFADADT